MLFSEALETISLLSLHSKADENQSKRFRSEDEIKTEFTQSFHTRSAYISLGTDFRIIHHERP